MCPDRTARFVRISDPDIFFLHAIAVPPTKFRPASFAKGSMSDHPQNDFFVKILGAAKSYGIILTKPSISDESRRAGRIQCCVDMQTNINAIADNTPDTTKKVFGQGIKQLVERKQGIFRKNMMGKRVNYAARSVISPDPYLDTDEIGIPKYFAQVELNTD